MKYGKEIIHIALERLRKITGLEATDWEWSIDGCWTLRLMGSNTPMMLKVNWETITAILKRIQPKHRFMLFARHIFPKIKEELRKWNSIWANGNIYLKGKYFIDTWNRNEKNKGNRHLPKQVWKYYLSSQNKEAINLTQRELAENTNVDCKPFHWWLKA